MQVASIIFWCIYPDITYIRIRFTIPYVQQVPRVSRIKYGVNWIVTGKYEAV